MFNKLFLLAAVMVPLTVLALALFAAPGLFFITYRVSSQNGTPPSVVPGGLAIAPGTVMPSAPEPAWTLAPCTADSLMASSAEVTLTNGVLSGSIYIAGRRAMPTCTVQGTPVVEILDANGNLLPVTLISAPMQTETAEPVLLGSPDRPYPAVVSIVWSNFCQAPTPPSPCSLRITLPDGDSLPLTPPLITTDAQGQPAPITSFPRCDTPTAPSTLMVGPFRAFASTVPHEIAARQMNETGPANASTPVPTLTRLPVMTATPRQPSSIGQILFASKRDGNLEIYLMNLTELPRGTGETKSVRLTKTLTRNGPPVPSPDGKRIAFVAETDVNGTKDREIYAMNIDGSGLTNLTNHPALDQEPTWSPDGLRIAFTSNRDGEPYYNSIYTMNADGSDVKRLAQNGDGPAWSPDGKKITFLSSRDQQIYIVNADGSDFSCLTDSPAPGNGTAQGVPVWSPDGKRIAFRSNRDGNSEIYLMNADGSAQSNLTHNQAYDDFPVWSPDGQSIAFISNRDGRGGLYIMGTPQAGAGANTGDGDVIRLAEGSAVGPRWSPDGRWIAYVGDSGNGNQDIYLVSTDGRELISLTNDPAQDTFPVWLP